MSDRLAVAVIILATVLAAFAAPADDSDAAASNTATVTSDGEVSGVLKTQCVAGSWGTARMTAVLSPASAGAPAAFSAGAISDGLEVAVDGFDVKFKAETPGDYHFTVSTSIPGYACVPLDVQVTATPAGAYTHVIYFINSVGGGEFEGTRMTVAGTSDSAKTVTVEFPDVSNFGYSLEKWTVGKDGRTVDHTVPCTLSVPANGYVSLVSHWVRNSVTVADPGIGAMAPGETARFPLDAVFTPAPDESRPMPMASFEASSSGDGLRASLEGRLLVLEAVSAGTYQVTITPSASGYQSAPLTVDVAVSAAAAEPDHPITYVDGEETLGVQRNPGAAGAAEFAVHQPDARKAGYRLAGWSYEAGGEAEVHDGDTITVGTSGVTLYAVWEECPAMDWVPWALIALGIILVLLGYFRCFPLLIPAGIVPIVLGACELLGVTNFF